MFSKYSGMGDIICTFPTALQLKAKHPYAPLIYNCHQIYACLPRLAGVTHHVTSFQHLGILSYWYRWLFAAFYEFPCADEVPDDFCKDYVVKEYALDHGVTVADAHPRLELLPGTTSKVTAILKSKAKNSGPFILFQTGPTWKIREWPLESWAKLVCELNQHGYLNIFQVGTDNHLSVGSVAAKSIPGAISLVNQFTLEETVSAISACDLFVGIDSGLIHLAAALRIPCVGIFGPTSPKLRLPQRDALNCAVSTVQCQGCHHRVPRIHWESGCPYDAQCMKTIFVSDVLARCLPLLHSRISC